jgi:hypothetical protein
MKVTSQIIWSTSGIEPLSSEYDRDFLAVYADASAGGEEDVAVRGRDGLGRLSWDRPVGGYVPDQFADDTRLGVRAESQSERCLRSCSFKRNPSLVRRHKMSSAVIAHSLAMRCATSRS